MKKAPFGRIVLVYLHRAFLIFFYHLILRPTAGTFTLLRFKPNYDVPREVRHIKPPFVVLADHVHPMDMFINGMGLLRIIHWVAADANFRTPFMNLVMTLLAGAVAKAKNKSDMVTLSRLKLLTETGNVIGVYQEGERSWDGVGLPPVPGTDKLIRFLKVPVIYCHLEGAYLEHPRWTWSGNKRPVNVRYEIVISPEEAGKLPLSEITRRIETVGRYDEWAYQAEARVPLRGNKRAENVELVCFLCPSCLSVNTLKSRGNSFSCSACGLQGGIDEFGWFEWSDAGTDNNWPTGKPFPTVRQWNLWQSDHYRQVLKTVYGPPGAGPGAVFNPSEHLFWEDVKTVKISRGKRGRQMKLLGIGSARFYGDRIELDAAASSVPKAGGLRLSMPLDDISSFSVFKQFYAEFYFDRELYQLSFTSRSVSGYKWQMLFRMILEHKRQQKTG